MVASSTSSSTTRSTLTPCKANKSRSIFLSSLPIRTFGSVTGLGGRVLADFSAGFASFLGSSAGGTGSGSGLGAFFLAGFLAGLFLGFFPSSVGVTRNSLVDLSPVSRRRRRMVYHSFDDDWRGARLTDAYRRFPELQFLGDGFVWFGRLGSFPSVLVFFDVRQLLVCYLDERRRDGGDIDLTDIVSNDHRDHGRGSVTSEITAPPPHLRPGRFCRPQRFRPNIIPTRLWTTSDRQRCFHFIFNLKTVSPNKFH